MDDDYCGECKHRVYLLVSIRLLVLWLSNEISQPSSSTQWINNNISPHIFFKLVRYPRPWDFGILRPWNLETLKENNKIISTQNRHGWNKLSISFLFDCIPPMSNFCWKCDFHVRQFINFAEDPQDPPVGFLHTLAAAPRRKASYKKEAGARSAPVKRSFVIKNVLSQGLFTCTSLRSTLTACERRRKLKQIAAMTIARRKKQ